MEQNKVTGKEIWCKKRYMNMGQILEGIVIKKEFDHSYLLIKADSAGMESYPFFMISRNSIHGLLPCRIRYVEDVPYYSYDISSKKTLEQEYQDKKLDFEQIKELFYEITDIIKGSEAYLLETDGFVWYPEHIYKDLETEKIFCLYLPLGDKEREAETEKYRKLADFFLDKIDHKDEHGINCVYQFYKMSKESFFVLESFLGFIEKEETMLQAEKKKSVDRYTEAENSSYKTHNDYEETESSEEKEVGKTSLHTKGNWLPVLITVFLGAILIVLYLFVPYLRNFALYLLLPGMMFMIVGMIFAGKNIYDIYQDKKEAEWEMPTEKVTVEEYFDDGMDSETVYFEEELCFQLKWKEGHFSREYYLRELPVTVGKIKEKAEVCIEDDSVSRLHACFIERGREILLQDLDSTNGTFVNGQRLAPGELKIINRGNEIQFGKIIVNVV